MLKREKVYRILAERIRSGQWQGGFKLPSEPLLCRELGVARVTLRAALEQLTSEGVLQRSRPGGTVVTADAEQKKKIIVLSGKEQVPDIARPELYIIPGIERRCLELNYEVEYMESAFLTSVLPENYLGAILLAHNFNGDEKILEKMRLLKFPLVNAHVFPHDPALTGLPSVRTDFRSAFLAGLQHLHDMGHRKVGFIMRSWEISSRRLDITPREFPALIQKAGLIFEERLLLTVPDNETDFSEELHTLIFSDAPPTALYTYSDYFAMRTYNMLQKWHVRIPEEMAVLGFSGYSSAALQSPPLSTVDFGYARVGRIAVDMLRNQDKWFGKSTPVLLSPYEVITRRSTDFYRLNFDETENPKG